jgi:hypothetical protein
MVRLALVCAALALVSCASCGSSIPAPRASSPSTSAQPAPPAPAPTEAVLPPRPEGPARAWSTLGTNLDWPADWSEVTPFIDGFRLSRAWTSAPADGAPDDAQPIDVDEHGWVRSLRPGQVVRTGIHWDVSHLRAGRYTVLYAGQGELATFGGVRDRVIERSSGRLVVDFDPERDERSFGLILLATDPADPIRDIRVLAPGGACREEPARFCEVSTPGCACLSFVEHHASLVFHPDFLADLRSYASLRFMNWQLTNGSTQERWQDRPRVEDARWSVRGVPPEVMIDLANRLGAEPWLCIPHLADDTYARELGRLVRERLDPALRVRVELSNELWNSIFPQFEHARQQGLRLGLGGPERDLTFAQVRWVSRRSQEVWRAFDEGFGDRARTIRVLGSFSINPWITGVMLDFETTAEDLDEIAIAPYFGPLYGPARRAELLEGGTEGALREAEASLAEVMAHAREQALLARRHGARLVAYEGGQHLVAVGGLEHDLEAQRILHAANRDPRMGALYTRYFEEWQGAGGTLMVHFIHAGGWNDYGSWGAREHLRQDPREAPKYLALERFARTVRPSW